MGSGYYTEDLKLMRPDGSRRRFLWPMAITGNLDATWSPDGRQILTTDATEHLVARDIRDGHVTFRGGPTSVWSWQPVPIRSR